MKPWVVFALLLIVIVCLIVFRLGPHGGIVTIWSSKRDNLQFSGGDATGFTQSVVISNGSRELAKNYEIEWLWRRYVNGVSFENFDSNRITTNGETFDVVTVMNQKYYFNVSKLR